MEHEQAGLPRVPYRIPVADCPAFFEAVQTILRVAAPDTLFVGQFVSILMQGDYLVPKADT